MYDLLKKIEKFETALNKGSKQSSAGRPQRGSQKLGHLLVHYPPNSGTKCKIEIGEACDPLQ